MGNKKTQTVYYTQILPDDSYGGIGEITYNGEPPTEGLISFELGYGDTVPIIGRVVIPCKNCEHWDADGYCHEHEEYGWREDDFCSKGLFRK